MYIMCAKIIMLIINSDSQIYYTHYWRLAKTNLCPKNTTQSLSLLTSWTSMRWNLDYHICLRNIYRIITNLWTTKATKSPSMPQVSLEQIYAPYWKRTKTFSNGQSTAYDLAYADQIQKLKQSSIPYTCYNMTPQSFLYENMVQQYLNNWSKWWHWISQKIPSTGR